MKKNNQEIKHTSLPFWSWNDKLEKEKLLKQIDWMQEKGFGGFFMHARAGLKTEYLSEDWFECVNACIQYAKSKGMEAWAYDENGWPSGFVGGRLLENESNKEWYLQISFGAKDATALVSYDISSNSLRRLSEDETCDTALNVYKHISVSTVDILDDEVVEQFILETHECYKAKTAENFKDLLGFFTDEPQYYRRAIPFPHKIAELFFSEYNIDILDELGLLFVEKDGFRTFRYRYWKACQALMLENFAKKIYCWCEDNKLKITGHYVEERDLYGQMLFNAGIMPFYEYEHMPGIDWLCRRFMSVVPARQVGSVAAQLGKKEILTETFAMTGWDATPQELKAIAEFQYLYGPNRICQHLLPYSEREERKRDHPAHFSSINPWVDQGIYEFNSYFDWLGELLRKADEKVFVAVLHPIRSAYLYYQHGKDSSTEDLDNALITFSNFLAENQIAFHFVDETLLDKYGSVKDGKLLCGQCEYKYLILPKCYTMDKSTEKLLRSFIEQGGRVYLADEKPQYLEGDPFDYDYLKSNVTLDEIKAEQGYSLNYQGGLIYSVYKKSCDGDFIVLLNISDDESASGQLIVNEAEQLAEYNYAEDITYAFDGNFELKPLQSTIIYIGKTGKQKRKSELVIIGGDCEVLERDNNCLLLDFASFSKDGKTFSQKYPLTAIFKELLKEHYNGELWLTFPFDIRCLPEKVFIQSECENKTEILVNNVLTTTKNIAPLLKIGTNELVLKMRFYENKNVYLALFGKSVTETLKNCMIYDTYLENLYLYGDFGVYSKTGFTSGKEKNVILADEFYIDKRKDCVGELTQSGEPFFAGKIVLKKRITLTQNNVRLKLNGRIHFASITVNSHPLGNCDFNGEIDISSAAKVGENEIIIELYTSARNQLGPHHDAWREENLMLSPQGFEMFDGWNNYQNDRFRDCYSFVKSGLLPEDESAKISLIYYGCYKDNQKQYERKP